MKKTILILLLLISFSVSSQEIRKKCITITEEKLPNYKVKVIKTNHCVEPKEITIRSYVITEWERKKRKKRKKRKNEK
jgi:hypothetical protein|tara:strand:- start:1064 stop:1297 length:234 start_codon:yes stop_codon:yes gene_type:complete